MERLVPLLVEPSHGLLEPLDAAGHLGLVGVLLCLLVLVVPRLEGLEGGEEVVHAQVHVEQVGFVAGQVDEGGLEEKDKKT